MNCWKRMKSNDDTPSGVSTSGSMSESCRASPLATDPKTATCRYPWSAAIAFRTGAAATTETSGCAAPNSGGDEAADSPQVA